MTAVEILQEVLAQLPTPHHERAGLIRAIEILTYEPGPILGPPKRLRGAWPCPEDPFVGMEVDVSAADGPTWIGVVVEVVEHDGWHEFTMEEK